MKLCTKFQVNWTFLYLFRILFVTPTYWRASVASETLTGVTQLKIGDVCLFIYLYICLDVCMSFWDGVERGANTKIRRVSVRSAFDPVPNFTKQNPPV